MGGSVTPSAASAPLGVYTNHGTGRNRDVRHLEAVRRSLQWADEAAEHGDHANAIAWLRAVEAIGWYSDGGLVPAGTARMSNRTPHGGWWHGCCVWRLVVLRWRESDLG